MRTAYSTHDVSPSLASDGHEYEHPCHRERVKRERPVVWLLAKLKAYPLEALARHDTPARRVAYAALGVDGRHVIGSEAAREPEAADWQVGLTVATVHHGALEELRGEDGERREGQWRLVRYGGMREVWGDAGGMGEYAPACRG